MFAQLYGDIFEMKIYNILSCSKSLFKIVIKAHLVCMKSSNKFHLLKYCQIKML